jgi:MYXO-CTERM domain-containing protein
VGSRGLFQLILTAVEGCGGAGDFDVEFRYNRCEWTTGDASGGSGGLGGTPAQAGFDAGNTSDFVEIMNSRTSTIHTTLCTMSNVGEPGIWRFSIRSGSVVCPDAGAPCDTGLQGVCAAGRTNCVGSGTECVQDVMASPERCDALDNDCDGRVDEGDDLCGPYEVCEAGSCLAACFEFGCPEGQVCLESGQCIDAGCEGLECPEGQRCQGGACVGACEGVVCPAGRSCRGGRCVDLCEGLTCDDCTVCDDGLCVARCQFTPCSGGESCREDGSCIETACLDVVCPAGTVCRAGSCVDACEGAVCPRGEECRSGECVSERATDPAPSPGGDAGTGLPVTDAGQGLGDGFDAGVDGGGSREPPRRGNPGCACRAGAPSRAPSALLFAGLLALFLLRRRHGG